MPVQEITVQARRVVEGGIGDLDCVALAAVTDCRDFLDHHLAVAVAGSNQWSREPGFQVLPRPIEPLRIPVVHRHAQGALLRVASSRR